MAEGVVWGCGRGLREDIRTGLQYEYGHESTIMAEEAPRSKRLRDAVEVHGEEIVPGIKRWINMDYTFGLRRTWLKN